MTPAEFSSWLRDPNRRCLVMGVLNVTPDSFSDGGLYLNTDAALAHAEKLCSDGADLIDIGGESTRPGSPRINAAEQIRRILPVFQTIQHRLSVVLSVDTTHSDVARAALEHGASVINDISAATDDPAMLSLAASRNATVILMHMLGQPATMQQAPQYQNVVADVAAYLKQRADAAEAVGVAPERILIDPGMGFGKTLEQNLELLRELRRLSSLGRPVVVGTSRKSFIGRLTGETEPSQRLYGTAATVAWSVANGAAMVRVHDVEAMAKVVRVTRAIAGQNG